MTCSFVTNLTIQTKGLSRNTFLQEKHRHPQGRKRAFSLSAYNVRLVRQVRPKRLRPQQLSIVKHLRRLYFHCADSIQGRTLLQATKEPRHQRRRGSISTHYIIDDINSPAR